MLVSSGISFILQNIILLAGHSRTNEMLLAVTSK